ncbi:hypothetical protein FISHEDRAFT_68384 [Fistulina hepatica ATCC 64428]|uniref:Uncharacterized protein n=1 Tax=Fistulina hepatica ATCC 64428 TaxID=1128425 RepID=A0A0D7AQJ8_9AGAR|nr:hypothetical protein FISHEDRAFT_68384 [Fistulina hepatica ATCC 64428]
MARKLGYSETPDYDVYRALFPVGNEAAPVVSAHQRPVQTFVDDGCSRRRSPVQGPRNLATPNNNAAVVASARSRKISTSPGSHISSPPHVSLCSQFERADTITTAAPGHVCPPVISMHIDERAVAADASQLDVHLDINVDPAPLHSAMRAVDVAAAFASNSNPAVCVSRRSRSTAEHASVPRRPSKLPGIPKPAIPVGRSTAVADSGMKLEVSQGKLIVRDSSLDLQVALLFMWSRMFLPLLRTLLPPTLS